ncbi:MAG: flippase [Chloroflexi bacterium]|nr:flippase [Chloroflexota bacterium]
MQYLVLIAPIALVTPYLAGRVWYALFRDTMSANATQRIAKNSALPLVASLGNKIVDFGFAVVILRLLGPEGIGKYTVASVLALYFEIVTGFGLDTLLTREAAKRWDDANRILNATVLLRLVLWLAVAPFLLAALLIWNAIQPLGSDLIGAVALLVLATIPSHVSSALSRLFSASERLDIPALVTVGTTICKVVLGLSALFLGWGIVGLAGVAGITNLATLVALYLLVREILFRPRLAPNWVASRALIGSSYPLMLNNLLAIVFFRFDVILLQALAGATVVGWYGTAYKFVDALLILPSTFTFAVFPLLSRYAGSSRAALAEAYDLGVRYLTILGLGAAAGLFAVAPGVINLFADDRYLPHSAYALQLLVWFLPLSFVNGLTQYVVIAVDRQRAITSAFALAAIFNLGANVVLIPLLPGYGYLGAALVTVLSELVLFIPFVGALRQEVALPRFLRHALRPALAGAAVVAVLWPLREASLLLTIPLGGIIYLTALFLLGELGATDRKIARQLVGRKTEDG